jgi:nicotinamide mononucleotide transporter
MLENTKNYFNGLRKFNLKNYFYDWSLWEKGWLLVSTIMILVASFIWKDSWYGVVASLSGIWCVVLVAKARVFNYIPGIINAIFYAYVAYQWQLYGEVMLNAFYFLPMQFVGFHIWTKKENLKDADTVKTKKMTGGARMYLFLITTILIIAYGAVLDKIGGRTPYIDSMSTVLSVVAMLLMAKLYVEQWVLWIIVDVVTIIMWINVVFVEGGNDIALLIMWTAYLINAVYGLKVWTKQNRIQES